MTRRAIGARPAPAQTVLVVDDHEGFRARTRRLLERSRFLVVEEQTPDGLRLNTPAGHLDPGESPADGCVRETLEDMAPKYPAPDGWDPKTVVVE